MNPLKKIAEFLGIIGVQGRDIEFDLDWSPRGTDSKVPLAKRVESRRRKNKVARKSRQKNRS